MAALALAGLLALFGLSGCGSDEGHGHGGRGVLVIAIDSLRIDHLSLAGYDRDTTPELDALARQGFWFSETFAAAPDQIPAHVGILTGCDPVVARQPNPKDGGFRSLSTEWRIPPSVPAMAVEFLSAGHATVALVDHPWLLQEIGFGAGFESFVPFSGGTMRDSRDFGAAETGRGFLSWLKELDSSRDWFAYLTINDLERSMRAPDPRWDTYFEPRGELDEVPPVSRASRSFFAIPEHLWAGGQLTVGEYQSRYDGTLRQLDEKLGRLFAQLDTLGRLDETTICVIGTYGIGFGESGLYLDHGTLSDVDLAVPWILRPASSMNLPVGLRSSAIASTIDIAPTLIDLHGLEVPRGMHGKSQLPALLTGRESAREFVYSRGGLRNGFAVHDERYSYQFSSLALRGNQDLTRSWYGQDTPPAGSHREYLRDRDSTSGPGDLEPSAVDPQRMRSMRMRGERWYEWIDHACLALHDPPWMEEPVTPEVRAELVRRGLIE